VKCLSGYRIAYTGNGYVKGHFKIVKLKNINKIKHNKTDPLKFEVLYIALFKLLVSFRGIDEHSMFCVSEKISSVSKTAQHINYKHTVSISNLSNLLHLKLGALIAPPKICLCL